MKLLFTIFILTVFISCARKSTDDPIAAYQYWAGEKPSNEVQVINGKHCNSARMTKEYVTYLELKSTPVWCSEMIRQNNLIPGTTYIIPEDAPSWFKPKKNYKVWKPSGFDQASFYLEDAATGHIFIYEVHL